MPLRERVRRVVESRRLQQAIIAVIVINAITLGAETSPLLVSRYGPALHVVDQVALHLFVLELLAKAYVQRLRFLRDPWNVFDVLIVGVSFLPTVGGVTVLRALRILRALRLISVVPSLRRVVAALLTAIPGMASIVLLLGLVLYVGSVMATKLYGATAPEYFGDLPTSLFTLFQIMTGDSWSEISREVMAAHPTAWVFFILFVLICTFVVLNLFIAVVVRALEDEHQQEHAGQATERDRDEAALALLAAELAAVRAELQALREAMPAAPTR